MRVGNAGSAENISAAGAGMALGLLGQSEDAQSKNIQKQIEEKQKELSELSSKEDMSPEEKMKKRQELTKEISDLNMQLRQHQMEKRMQEKAERQKKSRNAQNTGTQRVRSASKGKKKTRASGLSTEGMSAMLSADTSMKQAQVQGSVSNSMENRAGVIETEIKLDSARGGSTEGKEAALADVRARAENAANAQASTLREANEDARRAAEAERSETPERTEAEHSKKAGTANKTNTKKAGVAGKQDAENAAAQIEEDEKAQGIGGGDRAEEKSQSERYPSVDVRI